MQAVKGGKAYPNDSNKLPRQRFSENFQNVLLLTRGNTENLLQKFVVYSKIILTFFWSAGRVGGKANPNNSNKLSRQLFQWNLKNVLVRDTTENP